MSSFPIEKICKKWMKEFSWPEFNNANLMVCKLWSLHAGQNRTVMCSISKCVQGNSNYKKSPLKDCNLSAPHDLPPKSKETFDASSVPQKKSCSANSTNKCDSKICTANEWEVSNNIDQTTWHSIIYCAVWTSIHTFGTPCKIRKTPQCYLICGYENESTCRNFTINMAEYFFWKMSKRKLVNFLVILPNRSVESLSKR